MAQNLLPPTPIGVPPGHSFWNDWYEKLRNIINNISSLAWNLIDFTGSNITDIVTRNHNDLQNIQGGSAGSYFHLTSAQHTDLTDAGDSALHFHSTDRARANHTGTQLMSTISDLPTLTTGTYTPTLTSVANISASTAYSCMYFRIGSIVHVAGKIDLTPTSNITQTSLGVSLPIASNFANEQELAGVGTSPDKQDEVCAFKADTTNDRAELDYVSTASDAGTNHSVFFTFTYRII